MRTVTNLPLGNLIAAAVLLIYGGGLLTQSLAFAFALAIITLVFLIVSQGLKLKQQGFCFQRLDIVFLVAFLGISTKILFDPLTAWDARSIWFFHAKMIFVHDGTGLGAGWDHPSIAYTHPSYPKLIPMGAALIARALGYWNEYLPKGVFIAILAPALLWLRSVILSWPIKLFLFLAIFCGVDPYLWNGYLDGYVAIYAAISMLLLSDFYRTKNTRSLWGSLLALAVCGCLKNEGTLLFAGGWALCTWIALRSGVSKGSYFLSSILAATPIFIWSVQKALWGLKNYLDEPGTWSRFLSRLTDGYSVKTILVETLIENSYATRGLILLGIALTLIGVFRKKLRLAWTLPLALAIIYYFGLFFVYLITTTNLDNHLETSASRVMLTVSHLIWVALALLGERQESVTSSSSTRA